MATINKLNLETENLVDDRLDKLRELVPEAFSEAGVDFEKLRVLLGDEVEDENERYAFTWPGKMEAIRASQIPSSATLRPVLEKSRGCSGEEFSRMISNNSERGGSLAGQDPLVSEAIQRRDSIKNNNNENDNCIDDCLDTQNLYIEGDNLEVLKLLQRAYHGKIKMIYIDPPYNTGHDFVYHDDFKNTIENYKNQSGLAGQANPETSGRFHSAWCSMMYPRLKLARELLRDDGVIFISIDDNEVANLSKICDEIFGENNRIALICHKSRASVSNDKIISPNHNTIAFYAKDITKIEEQRSIIGITPDLSNFTEDDNDGRGPYRLVPVDGPGGASKGNPYYEFMGIEKFWRFSLETMQKKFDEGLVVKRGNSLYQKYYKSKAERTRRTVTTWWDDAGLTSTATSKLKTLMGGTTFDTPKPLELIIRMLEMATFECQDSIILDFFSGSATTAHAVMKLNAEDGGNRKFIMVQLPEVCDENSEAAKAGFANICEIGEERIRRAGNKIKAEIEEENAKPKLGEEPKQVPDVGFRVLKLDESNFITPKPGELLVNVVKDDRNDLDILFEMMLKWGLDLSLPIEKIVLCGYSAWSVAKGELICCMEEGLTLDVFEAIGELAPRRVLILDKVLDDNLKLNAIEIFKHAGKVHECEIELRSV